ncbi:hypothetical protein BCV72DRAFT_301929 [Rhizopus microsporus var. microsporus]|uniref:Uncharacterized protein n=1 Tax=Rhizopus microsporus var. microsporus TaxID=86635 RepID=A0A1X0RE81_RHIZD|nr:hypothetical protein BCV72DRAFT_301929 [Rhizopus microsporus var. microsporus]
MDPIKWLMYKTYIVNSIFTQQALTELAETYSKSYPEPSKEFFDFLNTFNRRGAKDLRQSIFASQSWDTEYDKELHCDYDWARNMNNGGCANDPFWILASLIHPSSSGNAIIMPRCSISDETIQILKVMNRQDITALIWDSISLTW